MKFSDYGLSKSEWIALIDEWILSERGRKIMKRRILDGIKCEALAEEFDLSVPRLQKIIDEARDVLEEQIPYEKKANAIKKRSERHMKK